MSTPSRFLIVPLLSLVILSGCSRERDDAYVQMISEVEADAIEAKILLAELRAGRMSNALELLEQQIDSSVVVIDDSLPHLSEADRKEALHTLNSLKGYRVAYPRQQEAIIGDRESLDYIEEMRASASNILTKLE